MIKKMFAHYWATYLDFFYIRGMLKNLSFLLIFLFFIFPALAQEEQNPYADSLTKIYTTTKQDTIKIQSLLMLSEIYYRTNPDTLITLCEQALKFIDEKLKKKLSEREREIFIVNKGTAYTNMAAVYEDKGDLKKSLEFNNRGLEFYKSVNHYLGVSTVLNNIGKLMKLQGEFEEAINLYTESLKYADLCDDRKGKAYTIGNIGAIHYTNGNFNEALECFIKAKVMHKEVNDIYGLTISLNNIGSVYRNLNMLDLALKSFQETYDLCIQSGDLKQQSNSLLKISMVYGLKKDLNNAEIYGLLALQKSKDGESASGVLKALKNLYEIYKKGNKQTKALDYYEQFVYLRDSINTEDNQKAIIEQRIQLDYDRKLIADSIQFEETKKAEIAVKNIEIEQGKTQQMMLFGGLAIFILLSVFIFNRYKVSIKQAKIIEPS
ncbi:MAG: tetratricopeptide repeat protein [Flavobacteriales bacterium]|nr:tetratricopeptide repeat protein [Flavobacteriales bacterium]